MPVCVFAFVSNLALFLVKLYVGLSSNSISIYSDGVNNMFDGLGALLTAVTLGILGRSLLVGAVAVKRKTEELLSLVLSALVLCGGAYFAYTSLERLIYPTPVWFSMKYLYILAATATFKLVMFFVYRFMNRKIGSSTVKVMTYDCLLDFCITAVTVVSLAVSAAGSFSVDAVCGLGISAVIITGAVKMLTDKLRRVSGYVPAEKRELIEDLLKKHGFEKEKTEISFFYEESITGYISFADFPDRERVELLYKEIKQETDITMKTVIN
ncbi:MAG: cation transporter [Clostridia bacterium]|nr:cation transporter [Clostridia bacterium]